MKDRCVLWLCLNIQAWPLLWQESWTVWCLSVDKIVETQARHIFLSFCIILFKEVPIPFCHTRYGTRVNICPYQPQTDTNIITLAELSSCEVLWIRVCICSCSAWHLYYVNPAFQYKEPITIKRQDFQILTLMHAWMYGADVLWLVLMKVLKSTHYPSIYSSCHEQQPNVITTQSNSAPIPTRYCVRYCILAPSLSIKPEQLHIRSLFPNIAI